MTGAEVTPDILLLNANTDNGMTDRMVAHALRLHRGFRGATVDSGAPYISDKASLRAAAKSVERFVGKMAMEQRPDVLIIACFGDPAVRDLRAHVPFPVLGLAEASCHVACQLGRRFGIVTGGQKWPPILQELVTEIGLASRLSGIYALELTGDRIAQDRASARYALKSKVAQAQADGADVVILGGAGLIGFAEELQADFAVPLLDSVDGAVRLATGLAIRARSQ